MKKKSLSRHTNISLNLTPHYISNKFAGGGAFDNLTTASFYDNSTKATLSNAGGGTSVGGVFAGVEGMLESGLQNAKLNSTYNIQSDIADNLGQALGNQKLNTNDSLMEAWDNYNPLEHVHYHDIRGGSTFGRIWNTNMASIKGAEAGWNASGSPYGAIIGGIVGLGAGVGGWLAGDKKAARLKRKLNNEIDIVNDFGYTNIANQQANVERKNLLRAEGNYVAYGGDLNNTWLDKDFARQQMQGLYNNGIARKYPKGGNINIAIGQTPEQQQQQPQQQEQQKSTVESLLPYIMAAKQAREQREAATLLAQQQLARTQNQEPVYAQTAYSYNQNQQQPTTQVQTKSAYYADPSDELYNSIMGFEGFLETPQWDVDGYAIGYGDHNKELVDYYLTHKGEKYTKEEGSKLVKKTVGEVRKILSENIPNWNELTGPQQDALTSYGYNTGPWAIINHSPSLMKALADKDWKRAATHINRGWYQKDERGRELLGLRKRRNYERLPFLYPEMTTYGVLPDGTVVNPDDLLKVDLSKPYSFENGVWKNTSEFAEDNNGTVPVFVSNAFGGNLFPNGGTVDKYAAAGRRYKAARNALLNRGYSSEDATRLARILATQAIAETGYRDFDDNNYGGHLYPGTRTRIKFASEEDYWNKHIDNLDKKWPTWNTANSLDSYYDIINHTDLGLKTEADYNTYKKNHKDSIYLYAPEWENKNYRENLNAIYPRASKYYKEELVAPQFIRAQEPVNTEMPSWNNLHFGFGGNLFAYGTEGDPPYGYTTYAGRQVPRHYVIEQLFDHPVTTIRQLRKDRKERKEKQSPNFGGGKFRGAGAGGFWNEETLSGALDRLEAEKMKDKIIYTPGPAAKKVTKKSFGQIFKEHKDAGDKGFWLDGIYYTTETNPEVKVGKKRYHNISGYFPTVTREVEDSNGNVLLDSTATSFYSGQRIGKFDRKDDPNELANRVNGLPFYNGVTGFNGIKAYGGKLKKFSDPIKESAFQKWYKEYAKAHNLSLDPDEKEHYYDYRAYWDDNRQNKNWELNTNDHLPDTYKLPGHPTMSVESKYQPRNERGNVWRSVGLSPETDMEMVTRQYNAAKNDYDNYGGDAIKDINRQFYETYGIEPKSTRQLDSAFVDYDRLGRQLAKMTLDKYYNGPHDPTDEDFNIILPKERERRYQNYIENHLREASDAKDAVSYLKSFANSPGFERIINNQTNPNINTFNLGLPLSSEEYKEHKNKYNNMTPSGIFDIRKNEFNKTSDGSVNYNGGHHILLDERNEMKFPRAFTLGHELGHNTDDVVSKGMYLDILEKNDNTLRNYHDEFSNEKYADIQGLRYLLYTEGIYDSRGHKNITAEDIAKLRKKYPELRPLVQMDDEKVAKMLNLIAQNTNGKKKKSLKA